MDQVIVGFEDVEETIIDQLTRGSRRRDVVSVVGMPGLGKTTLAKKIYNHPSIRYYFHRCAWCSVSQSYESRKLLLNILNGVGGKDIGASADEGYLAHRLYQCLKGQRYLVVLDDIWDIAAWDALKESLPDDNNGSRIMFTSRIHGVALQAKSDWSPLPVPLRTLTDEESWELLEKKLFQENVCPPMFSEIGKQIAKNCKGLPLSVVLTAGLLLSRVEDLAWWEHIAESQESLIDTEGCTEILELSYKHLPEYLKPCFLYFAAFPEDEVIRAQRLVNLWIAEGFVQAHEMKRIEDVAKEYLMDLVARSLIIVSSRSSNGGVKKCSIHDLLRDFCLAKGVEENFLFVLRGRDAKKGAEYKHERLCIHGSTSTFLRSDPFGSCVRTLLLMSTSGAHSCRLKGFSTNFEHLQVLDADELELTPAFPPELTSLVLLRYLALRARESIRFPTSISNLVNLETFIVKTNGNVNTLPATVWTMKNLRHLDVGRFYLMGNVGLDGLAQGLENLQTFSQLRFSDIETPLIRIRNVRKLSCEAYSLCFFPDFSNLRKLESLRFRFASTGAGIGCPCFTNRNFPPTLSKLTFEHFRLPLGAMNSVGMLPNLEVLKLEGVFIYGAAWVMKKDEFLKLKFLKLSDECLSEWDAPDDAFPCLERLVLDYCTDLKEIPARFGVIPTLKSIEVRRCRTDLARSVKEIQEQQFDLSNVEFEVLIEGQFDLSNKGFEVPIGG